MKALGELGCEATLVPTSHPVVDIVRFQRLTCDLAEARGIDPDLIRWDEEPWDRARKSSSSGASDPGQRSSSLKTKRSACQRSSIEHDLLSTRPCARPIS